MILVNDLIETFLEVFSRYYWYWCSTSAGFLLRFFVEKNRSWDSLKRAKEIFAEIFILVLFTLLWGNLSKNLLSEDSEVLLVGSTMAYVVYILVKNSDPFSGYVENVIVIIKSVMVTILSFQTPAITLVGSLLTIAMAFAAYKLEREKLSDLIEIVIICLQSTVISIMLSRSTMNVLVATVIYVYFVETALFAFNYVMKDLLASYFGEE